MKLTPLSAALALALATAAGAQTATPDHSAHHPASAAAAAAPMAEGEVRVMRGALVRVELRNIGWVEGSVAWKQDNRFGIAFVDEIDPTEVRGSGAPSAPDFEPPRYTRLHHTAPGYQQDDTSRLRKI